MDQPGAKISFGFSKIIKKPNLVNQNGESHQKKRSVELIESIEGSSMIISGKNAEDDIPKELIIPMTDDQKSTPLAKLLADRNLKKLQRDIKSDEAENKEIQNTIKQEPVNESLEQQAARELIEDLQKKTVKEEVKVFELPLHPDELPLDGAKESSIDDYDRVPIGDFGKAMLRGMGWKEEKKKSDAEKPYDVPVQRPKGMGLGADKVIKKQPLLIAPNQSETLEIKRNACVKVLAGKHKNLYGMIEGFDDGGGRVIVKLAIGGLRVTLNEFMVQAVGKAEYAKYAKILNSAKYQEYKSGSEPCKPQQILVKLEAETSKPRIDPATERKRERSPNRGNDKLKEESKSRNKDRRRSRSQDRSRKRSKSRDRHQSSSHKSKSHNRDRSEDSSPVRKYRGRSRSREKHARRSSSSDDYSRKKKSSKHRKNYSSPDSRHLSDNEKKHKKKTKKRKRDR